uniref:3-keto-alpha-glucoside-1,2-lyase/3-keto-2-hydroxy-glucal hydratase domain-containing protein n=1 Tax=uncultured Armatimonadetes bacterium TaxID=157466 RepID=A0A6J4JYI7_9BACT|nr:hypothetical protein AVDCRST_MAG63-4326 [uncultured Armatimonadetes bacterium]
MTTPPARRALLYGVLLLGGIAACSVVPSPSAGKGPKAPPWAHLFDGKTLTGWERKAVHGGRGGLWEVRNGVLVGNQDADHSGGLLGTRRKHGDAEVELEFRADFPADSGLFLRTAPNGDGYQVTLDNKADGFIGSLYVPSSGFVAQDRGWAKKYQPGAWNRLRARIAGQPPRVQVWLNGKPTVDFRDTRKRLPRTGYLGLQVHGGAGSWGKNSRIRFRNLRLRDLSAPAVRP